MALVLTNGTIVTAAECYQSDVRIENESIVATGWGIARDGDEIQDVSGWMLMPGAIDVHTHFDLPIPEFSTADNFYTGSRAALAGGTTTIIDYATQFHGETLLQGWKNWRDRAAVGCFVDYGFHMAITQWYDDIEQDILELIDGGITSFKMYLTYDALRVPDHVILRTLKFLKEHQCLLCVHCENGDMINELVRVNLAKGNVEPRYHPIARPAMMEAEAINRLLCMAQVTSAPVYIVHLSTAAGLELVADAKARNVRVYAETCPHYLLLNESCYELPGFNGAKFVMSPPLRKQNDQEVLWSGIARRLIDTVATDHCSFNFIGQKERGRDDFNRIPNGVPGVEHRLSLLYTEGVMKGRMTVNRLVDLLSTRPAKIFGMFPRKGTIAPGCDADIVVWNPAVDWTITAASQLQNVDYTPYEGMQVNGRVEQVYLRGQPVVLEGRILEKYPQGNYIKRERFSGRS